ncbi:sulfotransferase family protein [Mangrovivirga sp. M17]|uniref:Sulfotransferase family protein n=1 Tax=Mangrovivirga halotolerans TaxID=2993936 RepID=A0ABT3RS69_9BACT|nr:sulfotransferase family protein [Mangrovivirga halotolerans]MCX2744193.1 sulfotransferase family protein [Mangrovivirga halotolerans]
MKIIHLISGPRNISTAMMYAFAQRSDTTVIDEPFYGYYLKHSDIDHPGKEEILNSMETDPEIVIKNLYSAAKKTPVLFIKDMAKHIQGLNTDFMNKMHNVFLIREPSHIIASFSKVVDHIPEKEIGYSYSLRLYEQLIKKEQNPLVIDSGIVLGDPESSLIKICDALGIEYQSSMLTWQPGPRQEDGIWAKYWYNNVHKSAGLKHKMEKPKDVDEKYYSLYLQSIEYYKELLKHAIK